MKEQVFKYLVYIITLPLIGFCSMFVLRPLTSGAHDGGFLGMVFGLIVGQIIFTSWLTDFKWYTSIFVGVIMAALTIPFSFWAIEIIKNIYFEPNQTAYYGESRQSDFILKGIFFVVLLLTSILFLKIVDKLTEDPNPGTSTK
jgi:hypothetical protein